MAHDHRRRILKGLALTLPAAWTTPLVKSVVLPAHAQTSQCAPAGCYNASTGGSFHWPGGTGPHAVTGYDSPDCAGDRSLGSVELVVASSSEEASSLLSCSDPATVFPLPIVPPLPGDCAFYECVTMTIM